jgi:peptide/nickel transport system permease protein
MTSQFEAEGAVAAVSSAEDAASTVRSPTRRAFRRLARNGAAVAAICFIGLLVVTALFAPLLAPYNPDTPDVLSINSAPSAEHLLGTDQLGRDNLSRLIYGTRVSLLTAVAVVGIATAIAVPVGLSSGYKGRRFDNLVMRLVDVGLAFPPLVLALAVAGVMGAGVRNSILALSLVFAPSLIRLLRGQALAVREETFIEASRAMGTPTRRILARRMFPNVRSVLIVQASLMLGAAMLAEASLSYLGLGAVPPTPSWGGMLRTAYDTSVFTQQWQLIGPGAAIALSVYAFNTLGDSLRDALGVGGGRRRARRSERQGLTTVRRLKKHERVPAPVARPVAEHVLEIRGLSIDFGGDDGDARVVDDLNLTVDRGEIVGLVGESGAGKSVTSLAIMRLLPSPPATITSGQVLFQGRDLLTMKFDDIREVRGNGISMVFQDPMTSLDSVFTIGDQLIEAQRLHSTGSFRRRAALARAVELLDLVGIPAPGQRVKEYPHQLSGGMRQRAMIAIALACEPQLLIADEPTTALDVTVQAQILELLQELRTRLDMSVLIVTHDLGVVAEMCDRVAVMYAGQIVEQQAVSDLFSRPLHPYTAGLLDAMPQVGSRRNRLAVIPGHVPMPWAFPTGCRFHPRCGYATEECMSVAPTLTIHPSGSGAARCLRSDELELVRDADR